MGGGIVEDIVLLGIGSERLETSMERRLWRRGIGLGPRTIVPYLAPKIEALRWPIEAHNARDVVIVS
jgi:hypothetical protein